jgi:hypothetical protein
MKPCDPLLVVEVPPSALVGMQFLAFSAPALNVYLVILFGVYLYFIRYTVYLVRPVPVAARSKA